MSSFIETSNTLKNETDRGAVLIAAAMLELSLEKLLAAKLVKVTTKNDPVFDNNGALGTFSSKIEMCYRLGLITKKQKILFDVFRRIRNEFAHSANSISLRDLNIRDRLFAAINDHPVKNRYIAALQANASNMGIPVESISMNSIGPRDLFELIFGLEIEFLNIALVRVESISELKG